MASRYPFPPYANGWFRIAYADEIPTGELATFPVLGRELVAFRDAEGTARVLDAFCPHLGAHLGQSSLGRRPDPVVRVGRGQVLQGRQQQRRTGEQQEGSDGALPLPGLV